ncbi:hypothetical protein BpHYR1_045439 [Brachionus plicatilis]|uniref:Uncharacterized protein n=1 Tax=Brachionus plicatilis TaxID=10195 RepID=A0A3M7PKB2_BRAPC|nr:hypothetical protein BpHYR1_045439 [Brachionus plicatilis]
MIISLYYIPLKTTILKSQSRITYFFKNTSNYIFIYLFSYRDKGFFNKLAFTHHVKRLGPLKKIAKK